MVDIACRNDAASGFGLALATLMSDRRAIVGWLPVTASRGASVLHLAGTQVSSRVSQCLSGPADETVTSLEVQMILYSVPHGSTPLLPGSRYRSELS